MHCKKNKKNTNSHRFYGDFGLLQTIYVLIPFLLLKKYSIGGQNYITVKINCDLRKYIKILISSEATIRPYDQRKENAAAIFSYIRTVN